jgi:hypothetical protein
MCRAVGIAFSSDSKRSAKHLPQTDFVGETFSLNDLRSANSRCLSDSILLIWLSGNILPRNRNLPS